MSLFRHKPSLSAMQWRCGKQIALWGSIMALLVFDVPCVCSVACHCASQLKSNRLHGLKTAGSTNSARGLLPLQQDKLKVLMQCLFFMSAFALIVRCNDPCRLNSCRSQDMSLKLTRTMIQTYTGPAQSMLAV